MNSTKFLTGTLVGGIAFFFLGYLIYGLALGSFFREHSVAAPGAMKTMGEIVWWALIFGDLASGALITWIFLRLGTVTSFSAGFRTAAIIGLFVALSMDLIHYATENSFDLTSMFVDVLAGTLMYAIAGGLIAALLGRGKK